MAQKKVTDIKEVDKTKSLDNDLGLKNHDFAPYSFPIFFLKSSYFGHRFLIFIGLSGVAVGSYSVFSNSI